MEYSQMDACLFIKHLFSARILSEFSRENSSRTWTTWCSPNYVFTAQTANISGLI